MEIRYKTVCECMVQHLTVLYIRKPKTFLHPSTELAELTEYKGPIVLLISSKTLLQKKKKKKKINCNVLYSL